jgi:N4-gp56 family major capsid protein
MKTLSELSATEYDVQAILPKIIMDEVETVAREKRYGRQLLKVNTDLVGAKGRSILVARRTTLSAGRVSENANISDTLGKAIVAGNVTESAYGTVEVVPFKVGTWIRISQEAIDGQNIDVLRDMIEEAGETLADQEDLEIFNELYGRTSVTNEKVAPSGANKVYTLAHKPILEKVSAYDSSASLTAMTVAAVDYKDGKVKLTESAKGSKVLFKYDYSARTSTFIDADTAGKFEYEDMVKAKTALSIAKRKANVLVIHPSEEAQILTDDRFVDASRFGSNEPIMNGSIGKISGMQVLVTTNAISGCPLIADTSKVGYFVIKREIDMKRQEKPEADAHEIYFYQEYAPKVINEDALCFITNVSSDANKNL